METEFGPEIMAEIGNVEIPIISSVEDVNEAAIDEIKPLNNLDSVTPKHEPGVTTLLIGGYLNEELHSSGDALDEQKESVKSLRGNSPDQNSFVFDDYKGYLLVEEVDLDDNADSKIVKEVEIEARYFPWPKFYPDSEP